MDLNGLLKVFIKSNYRKIRWKYYMTFYQLKFTSIKWGEGIKFNSRIILAVGKSSIVEIGNNIVFNNSTRQNFVGINKPCSIYVEKGALLNIGKNTGFSGVSIFCSNKITIGEYCNFGGNVSIWDTDFHPLEYNARRIHVLSEIKSKPIHIGNDVFIGANSLILKGVRIGDRSIVGAGSVVTKDIAKDEIWAGNPAKFIKRVTY